MSDLTVRTLTPDDFAEFSTMLSGAFLVDNRDDEVEVERAVFEPERHHGVYDGTRLVGSTGIQTRLLTVPGAGPTPAAGVTAVGVAPDARRRGVLNAAMRAELDELHESGTEPVAVLWASQAPIYGRFGYGCASTAAHLSVSAQAPFRPGVDAGGRVELLDASAAGPVIRAVHSAVAPRRVGWLSRTEGQWRWWLIDSEWRRDGASAYRFAVHHGPDGPDGYVVFRVKLSFGSTGPDSELWVRELVAVTPQAAAALWRTLLDLDLVGQVRYHNLPLDDPLQQMLLNPRGTLTSVVDQLWARLVDVDRALQARRYAAGCDVVLELTDGFCPWNAGRWRLAVDADGTAEVTRTDAPAELRCDVADLGAMYLGGPRLAALAAAGRVHELRPGAVLAASRAFAGDMAPHCPEVF